MAELSTIARPYAEALFSVARLGDSAAIERELNVLATLANHEDIMAWVNNPLGTADTVLNTFRETAQALHQAPISSLLLKTLELLIQNKRISLLPEIAHQFTDLKNTAEGASQVTITSAFELSEEHTQSLLVGLNKKFGVILKPKIVIDAQLIGGVRVQVGDQVLDTSIQAQLEQMRIALMA
jgi:F-type H+-transporting ATPase subunit delta